MTIFSVATRHLKGVAGISLLALICLPVHAQTQSRWQAHEEEALATLPLPRDQQNVSAASLSCNAQKWTLRIDFAETPPGEGAEAAIRIDGMRFSADVERDGTALTIRVPREALEPLKAGLRLEVEYPSTAETTENLSFALRGSRIAITTVEERCSHRDMSAYQAVSFTPYSSYMELARELRAEDISAFIMATTAKPDVQVAMAEFGESRRILFTRLCGSSWYFGTTGCNITGYAPEDAPESQGSDDASEPQLWRAVYDTENVHLFTDARSVHEGWRDVVTLPVRATEPSQIWRWDGARYALHGDLPDEEEATAAAPAVPLRGSHD